MMESSGWVTAKKRLMLLGSIVALAVSFTLTRKCYDWDNEIDRLFHTDAAASSCNPL